MINVMITGSSGFVGSNLCRALQAKNFFVIGLDKQPPKFCPPNQFVQIDIRDEFTLREILRVYKPAVLFHLAAVSTIQGGNADPEETWSTNFRATCNVANAVKAEGLTTKIFFASTDKVYGELRGVREYTEDLPLRPLMSSPYDCSKAAADEFIRTCGDGICVLRFCNLYGACDMSLSRVVPGTISTLMQGRSPVLNRYRDNEGKEYDFFRDMLFVDDLCDALTTLTIKSLRNEVSENIFNFGTCSPVSMSEVINCLVELVNPDCQPTVKIVSPTKELTCQSVNFARANRVLGFRPTTALRDGLRQTISWWKNYEVKTNDQQVS